MQEVHLNAERPIDESHPAKPHRTMRVLTQLRHGEAPEGRHVPCTPSQFAAGHSWSVALRHCLGTHSGMCTFNTLNILI